MSEDRRTEVQAAHLIISLPIIGLLSGYIIAKSTEKSCSAD